MLAAGSRRSLWWGENRLRFEVGSVFPLYPHLHTNRELLPMKLGRVLGGPVPVQLPFTKSTYNLSQVAGGAWPLLPFLINSMTLSVKGKSIPLKC